MEVKIEIPEYDCKKGISYSWTDNFKITVLTEYNEVIIEANKEGLLSLANHLINLAQVDIPIGHHMHFDKFNSLEDDSLGLIVSKVK